MLVKRSSPHFWKHRLFSCGKHTVYNVSGLVPSAISHTRALMEDRGRDSMSCSINLLLPPARNPEVPVSYSEAHSFGSAAWQLPEFVCLSSSALSLQARGPGI